MKRIGISARNIKGHTGTVRTIYNHIKILTELGYEVEVFGRKMDRKKIIESGGNPHKIFIPSIGSFFKRNLYAKISQWYAKKLDVDFFWGHGDNLEQELLSLHNCMELASEKVKNRKLPESSGAGKMHKIQLRNKRFKKIIANSELMKSDLIKRYNISGEKIEVIYPGYSPQQFNSKGRDEIAKKFRRENKISEDKLILGLVSSGDLKKRGVIPFIKSLKYIKENSDYKFTAFIIGKSKYVEIGKNLINELNLNNEVKFLPTRSDIQNFYKSLDLLIHPALFEEFGQVVQESIVCGTPVLTNEFVGSSEIFSKKDKDLYIMKGSTEKDIYEGLKYFLEGENTRKTWINRAKPYYKKNTWEYNTKKTYELIKQIIK